MNELELIATATFGLEAVVARELKQLGYDRQTVEDGRITFIADEAAIPRANLWLRSADRVLVKLGGFEARDFGELFDRTRALPWSDWLTADAAFPVRGKSVKSQLHSVPDCQSIVKKAIVEQLKSVYRKDWFDETGPACEIEVAILKDRVTLTLDTTGPGLHKRGYRTGTGTAPLKETLAAGLVQLSYWNAGRPFLDPFCGTGTIPIEAALIGRNIAPGLRRKFAAESWPRIAASHWAEARTEAADLVRGALAEPLLGGDIDARAVESARKHAQNAGVAADVRFQQAPLADLQTDRTYGCLFGNPPYGERLGDRHEAEAITRDMARVFGRLETWSIYVLTAQPQFEQLYGRRADRRRKLYNGRIECTYYQFQGPRPPRPKPPRPDESAENA